MQALKAILLKEHPFLYSLGVSEYITIDKMQTLLQDGDIYCQHLNSKLLSMLLVITSQECNLSWTPRKAVLDNEAKVTLDLLQGDKAESEAVRLSVIKMSERITAAYFASLINMVAQNVQEGRLYMCLPLGEEVLPISLFRASFGWLVEHVSSITRLRHPLSMITLQNSGLATDRKIGVFIFGNTADPSIHSAISRFRSEKIKGWLTIFINPDPESILEQIQNNAPLHLAVIIGHGIHEKATPEKGTIAIEGNGRTLFIDDLRSVFEQAENVLILSCSGGTGLIGQKEVGGGTLLSMLSQCPGRFILCRWDVPTTPALLFTRRIVKEIHENGCTLPIAVNRAQRHLLGLKEKRHYPVNWASYEVWDC